MEELDISNESIDSANTPAANSNPDVVLALVHSKTAWLPVMTSRLFFTNLALSDWLGGKWPLILQGFEPTVVREYDEIVR
jgi:hypothetical protein